MKIEVKQIERIRCMFVNMQTREDLLCVLNEANRLLYGKNAENLPLRILTKYANPRFAGNCYHTFNIKKKAGGDRQINAPVNNLAYLQKLLSIALQCVFIPEKAAYGFTWNKSIVDNAKLHQDQRYVYNIDLKDFFSSIDQARVWKCLQLKPFNLNRESTRPIKILSPQQLLDEVLKADKLPDMSNAGRKRYLHTPDGTYYLAHSIASTRDLIAEHESQFFVNHEDATLNINELKTNKSSKNGVNFWYINRDPEYDKTMLASMIAAICCAELDVERKDEDGQWIIEKRRVLPQGAPTSPVLTNIVCQRLDLLLTGVAKRFGLNYSRYADDITFSSKHNVYQENSEFIQELNRIISEQGFHIKESKTRLQKDGYRKEVTGLLVNENVNVSKRYIKQLRMWLYLWERYGYKKASIYFSKHYLTDKGHVKKGEPDLANVVGGKLEYLKMVKGSHNNVYVELSRRLDSLISPKKKITESKSLILESVLEVFATKGLAEAMQLYKEHK